MNSLVSIIIPCYNQARFLSEAIESVLKQSYSPLEVIVVDDGSSDNTSEVAARYSMVRLIKQDNQGLARARNRGLAESKGEYVNFLDADDRLLPNAIELGVRSLQTQPEWAFVHGRYRYIDMAGNPAQHFDARVERIEDYYEALLRRNFIGMSATVMYRRAVLESVGGFLPTLPVCEDYELYLRICRAFPVGRHDEIVAEYRLHERSLSRDYGRMLQASIKVLRSQQSCVKGHARYEEAYEEGLRLYREFYGERLIEDLRSRFRARGSKALFLAAKDWLTLLRYYPHGLLAHSYRKTKCSLRKCLRNIALALN